MKIFLKKCKKMAFRCFAAPPGRAHPARRIQYTPDLEHRSKSMQKVLPGVLFDSFARKNGRGLRPRPTREGGGFAAALPCGFIFFQKDMKNNSQGRPRQLGELFLISFLVLFGDFSKAQKIGQGGLFHDF